MTYPSLYRIPGDTRGRLTQMRSTCAGAEFCLKVAIAFAALILVLALVTCPWLPYDPAATSPWPTIALAPALALVVAAKVNEVRVLRRFPYYFSHVPLGQH